MDGTKLASVPRHSTRMAALDVLRFASAVAVMLYHYTVRGSQGEQPYVSLNTEHLQPYFQSGHLGVNLFFMISGFVILISAAGKSPWSFLRSRALRLYPAYWICCLITAGAIVVAGHPRFTVSPSQVLLNLTMFHRHLGVPHVDGVYWSLVVELQFYALIFGLLLCRQLQQLGWYALGWLAVAEGLMWFDPMAAAGRSLPSLLLIAPWCCHFVAGIAFYLLRTQGVTRLNLVLLGLSYLACLKSVLGGMGSELASETAWLTGLLPMAWTTLFFGLFTAIITDRWQGPSWRGLQLAGAITYPLYLLHQNLGYLLLNALQNQLPVVWLVALVSGSMLGLAIAVHLVLERPLARWLSNCWRPRTPVQPAITHPLRRAA